MLADGTKVETPRTWHDDRLPSTVEYPYSSRVGRLKLWNVFQKVWPDARVTEEKWVGNAGFLVENEGIGRFVFRCSDAQIGGPDFQRLVFRLQVTGSPEDPS